jgi:hypothetical protein
MDSLQVFTPNDGALSAESYQTFELAKENDAILGGDSIAQIRSYAAYARAQAQAIHKTIAATSGIEDVAAIKQEALETEQTFAKVGIYADQRIGELLRELPTRQGKRTGTTLSATQDEVTKRQAMSDAGISKSQAYDLQAMASNPDVVQAVLDKAEAEGRVVSRKQVLDAIKERDEAEHDAAELRGKLSDLRDEVAALEKQNDQLYEQATRNAEPQIVERQVVPADYQTVRHERDVYLADVQKLRKRNEDMRKELDKAKDLLGIDKTAQDVRKDVQYLISATNQYVRQYGGLTWTAASLGQVEPDTLTDLRTAAINLATFANALVASLEDFNG